MRSIYQLCGTKYPTNIFIHVQWLWLSWQSGCFQFQRSHPEKLAGDHKKILIDGDLDFLKEAPFWNQEMKKIKFPMDVQKSYKLSKLIP